ncbi:putative serine/threonine-protein kinase SBK3 isoform X1 [Opisthocomus hoazin]|uniref:putative serine/threonine-protein kinase SBK3 isoform X1 n=2 Tax=Opisthocomus hoazin TaxID=30419 RepID=UPI003F52AB18
MPCLCPIPSSTLSVCPPILRSTLSVCPPSPTPSCLSVPHAMPCLSCLLPIFGPRHALGLTHVPCARVTEISAGRRHGSGQESLSHSSWCRGWLWGWGHPTVPWEHPTLLGHTAGDTGPMEESDEDGEDNEEFLERLMMQTGQEVPQRELEEDYAVLEELGSGTYGRVVLTEPRDGGSPVVLKLMLKEQTERRAFLREYCIALCLSSHAACLRALPIAFESATHFAFGQELAPAGDLCALLNPGEGLAEELVKRCASQLAEALDFMHSRALVHRDVKLDNVLLFDRECRRVKLGDFGLTRMQGSAVGAMSGTLPYAPPELCLLEGSDTLELDSSLDVWAFAVLLFCLCTGCFPWAVAASSDPQFEDFCIWQSGTEGHGVPASWRIFGSGVLEMFRRLLTLDPDRRSPAIEVQKYLSLPWVMAPSARESAPSSSQSPLTGSTGESLGGTGGREAAGGGDGIPVPSANALAPCR